MFEPRSGAEKREEILDRVSTEPERSVSTERGIDQVSNEGSKPVDERWSRYPETVLIFAGEPEVFVDLREPVPPATEKAMWAHNAVPIYPGPTVR